ncbi:MAG: hypothetical protein WCF18_24630 [Chthoniobacteraceae bacterium]
MKPFAALDEVLNSRAVTPAPARDIEIEAGAFKPLFTEKALSDTPKESANEHAHQAPEIELVQADGQVQQIIVTCRCGERTVLECSY